MRVLVIDDSKPVRSILARMLRELDFETCEATNGKEALRMLGEFGQPDLATVNWQMPEMDGLQFIRAVRSDRRYRELPLLMISSESEPSRMATALAAGANDYIVKPCTKKALADKLRQLGLATDESAAKQGVATSNGTSTDHTLGKRKIRVMIVDDSVVVRRVVGSVLSEDPDIDVVGIAADGQMALDRLQALNPDVVVMDIEMPILSGLDALKVLRKTGSTLPVIMFSSLTERGAAATTDALLLGADDYVAKPGGTHMQDPEAGRRAIREQLIPKIKHLSLKRVGTKTGVSTLPRRTAAAAKPATTVAVIAIASSTGGPCALSRLLPEIVAKSGVPILIVQHMPPLFTKHLADRLSLGCQIDVREGVAGEMLGPGSVRIAPGGRHMTVSGTGSNVKLQLNSNPPVNACRPAADVLFQSVADVYGRQTLAVVLTGMGSDGLLGCKCIQQAGGQVLVQDEASSAVWGMPGQVARAGLADAIVPLSAMGIEIARRVRKR